MPTYAKPLLLAILLAHLVLFCAGCALGAELPAEAQSLLNTEGLKETALKARYDADVAALRKELVPKLQRAQDAATKRGDLDGAMAIKAKVAEIDKGAKVDADTKPADLTALVGRWSMSGAGNGAVWLVKAHGQASSSEGIDGTYKLKDSKVVFEWNNGQVDTMNMIAAASDTDTTGISGRGADLRFHRMPNP